MSSALLFLAWQSPALFVSPKTHQRWPKVPILIQPCSHPKFSPTCCSCICCSGVLLHQITLHLPTRRCSSCSCKKMPLLAVQIYPLSSGDRNRESSTLLCLSPSCLAAQASPAPGGVHCCVLTYPLLQERSFTQGHPRHFPHPSLSLFFLLSSEPFPSSPLLVQLLAVKILALLMSWMWLLSSKAAF